jgi:hypothetical protein
MTECPFGEHADALKMLLEIKDRVSETSSGVLVLGAKFESIATLTEQAFERVEKLDMRVDAGVEVARQALAAARAADDRAAAAIVAAESAKGELTKYRNWAAASAIACLVGILLTLWEIAVKPHVNVGWK